MALSGSDKEGTGRSAKGRVDVRGETAVFKVESESGFRGCGGIKMGENMVLAEIKGLLQFSFRLEKTRVLSAEDGGGVGELVSFLCAKGRLAG